MLRKRGGKELAIIDKTTRKLHKKEQRKANYSDYKQCKQYKDQPNNN